MENNCVKRYSAYRLSKDFRIINFDKQSPKCRTCCDYDWCIHEQPERDRLGRIK